MVGIHGLTHERSENMSISLSPLSQLPQQSRLLGSKSTRCSSLHCNTHCVVLQLAVSPQRERNLSHLCDSAQGVAAIQRPNRC